MYGIFTHCVGQKRLCNRFLGEVFFQLKNQVSKRNQLYKKTFPVILPEVICG